METTSRCAPEAIVALVLLALAGCGRPDQADRSPAGQTTEHAATTRAASPSAAQPLSPPAPGAPGGLPDDRTPIAETPAEPGSAQEAATLVERYYALIESGNYPAARRLWQPGNAGAAESDAAFAAQFALYSEYHANVGAPGRIYAGAGQRHVAVPVQPYARTRQDGMPAYMIGTVTLHRTGDIDGATAEQRQWRITRISIGPAPR